MSDALEPSSMVNSLYNSPEEHELFAVVVDGEVGLLIPCHKVNNAMHVAIWSSTPQVVMISEDATKVEVRPGWLYDGTNFTPPTE
jgi:hypothetical protein